MIDRTQTTTEALAKISLDMLLTNAEIKAIDVMAMGEADFDQDIWDDFYGSTELNKIIYMAYKLNALLKTLEPATT